MLKLCALSLLLCIHALAQNDSGDDIVRKRIRLPDLIDIITSREVARIHFIEPAYTEAECLTIEQRKREIEMIPAEDRTPSEKSAFDSYTQLLKITKDTVKLKGYRYKRYDIKPSDFFNPATVEDTLRQCLKQNDPDFIITKAGDSFIIMPASCAEANQHISLQAKSVSPPALLATVKKMIEPHGIHMQKDLIRPLLKGSVSVSCADETIPIALTRITEALCRDYIWKISGPKEYRTLQIRKMNERTD